MHAHPYVSNQRYERLIISLNSKQLQARGLYIFVHIIYQIDKILQVDVYLTRMHVCVATNHC